MNLRGIALLVSVAGCLGGCVTPGGAQTAAGPEDPERTTVRVGMPVGAAWEILRENGAERFALASQPPKEEVLEFELPGKRLLEVIYDPSAGGAITELQLCDHPDVPRSLREWRSLEQVDVAAP
jgi:hypothetical protein